jgi:Protein of unknown function (DUF2511)
MMVTRSTAVPALAVAVLLTAGGCGAGTRDASATQPLPSPTSTSQQVRAENFGHLWPLSVDQGTLECRPGTQVIFVATDGTEYALNGKAEQAGIRSVDEIRIDGSGNGKVSLGSMLSKAMKLCGHRSAS